MFTGDACAIAALWETAWPAHPNRGACTKHELFVVWACPMGMRGSDVSLMVHGERQYTWIPTARMLKTLDRRNGCLICTQRPQSEFCKFVVDCFKHKRAAPEDSRKSPALTSSPAVPKPSAAADAAALAAHGCKDTDGSGGGGGDGAAAAVVGRAREGQ